MGHELQLAAINYLRRLQSFVREEAKGATESFRGRRIIWLLKLEAVLT
ncbi:MAG: hypothetical protein ACTS6P_01670 [Candidatus Hodgkinia cicadicola]